MARGNTKFGRDSSGTQKVISTAVEAAGALTGGIVRLAERTIVEAVRAAQDVGSEIGATLARAANGSIQAGREIGGDLAHAGRTVSRRITQSARDTGIGLGSMTDGLRRSSTARARKPLAKVRGQRRRRHRVA